MSTYPGSAARSNGPAIAGMVCGIAGLVLFNVVLGPLAIIFGSIGLSRANHGAGHRNMAISGIVLGVIDVAILIALVAASSHNGGSICFHAG